MVFEVYVAGPLKKAHEREQMNFIVHELNNLFHPRKDTVRMIIDVKRNADGWPLKQIDALLILKNQLVILEIKDYEGDIMVDFDYALLDDALDRGVWTNYRQPPWQFVTKVPAEMTNVDNDHRENPIDQVREQRRKLAKFLSEFISARRKIPPTGDQEETVVRSKRIGAESIAELKRFLMDRTSAYIITGKGNIRYSSPGLDAWVHGVRWLKIVTLGDAIGRISRECVDVGDEEPILTDDEFIGLTKTFDADPRSPIRWSTETLQHEYNELSRVLKIDFLLDSDDPRKILEAIKAAHSFGLRAYAEDIWTAYHQATAENVKTRALEILIEWEYERLGELLVHSLRYDEYPGILVTAINYLKKENEFPETLPTLRDLLERTYDSQKTYSLTPGIIEAIGNLGDCEAGRVIYEFLQSITSNDFYSSMMRATETHESISERDFELSVFKKSLEEIAACRYTKATDLVLKLLVEFPADQFVSVSEAGSEHEKSKDFMARIRTGQTLTTILDGLVSNLGGIWDGRSEDELIRKTDGIYQQMLGAEENQYLYEAVFKSYVRALSGIDSPGSCSALTRYHDTLPTIEGDAGIDYDWLRSCIIDAIGSLGQRGGYDFLIGELDDCSSDLATNKNKVVQLIGILGKSRESRFVQAISRFLDSPLVNADKASFSYVRSRAAVALARLDGDEAFGILMSVFLKEPHATYEAIRMSLKETDPDRRKILENRAEKMLLEKFSTETLDPDSRESMLLTEIASEASIPFMFALVKNPEWCQYSYPQRLASFTHVEGVMSGLREMLESKNEHQRAFALDVIGWSCRIAQDAGKVPPTNEIDDLLSKYGDDKSAVVRCSVIDCYCHLKRDSLGVASFFGDKSPEVRAHASYALLMTTHMGGWEGLVVSNGGRCELRQVVYNEKGLFLLDADKESHEYDQEDKEVKRIEPFYIAAREMSCTLLCEWRAKMKDGRAIDVPGLYVEQKGDQGLKLLILPKWVNQDATSHPDWLYDRYDLESPVLQWPGVPKGGQLESAKATELLKSAVAERIAHLDFKTNRRSRPN